MKRLPATSPHTASARQAPASRLPHEPPMAERRDHHQPGALLTPLVREAYDQLATMVAIVQTDGACLLVNSALENAVRQSRRRLEGHAVFDWFIDAAPLREALGRVAEGLVIVSRFEATLRCHLPGLFELPVHVIASPHGPTGATAQVMLEMLELEQQARLDREERADRVVREHKELLRNLAHEVKNPLGGIRGAAQLLGMEPARQDVRAYTNVIIHEVDRLQSLVDRLLAPHQHAPVLAAVNIHEICEHVCALVLAEFPQGLRMERDYDVSLPEFDGDRERLIQALLNVVRNAAQALAGRIMAGDARIVLRTRIARQVTLGGKLCRLALQVQVEDNGPGVPEALRGRIFQPLVSGRADGSGLGLTLAQAFVQQHGGTIAGDSTPAGARFEMMIPLA